MGKEIIKTTEILCNDCKFKNSNNETVHISQFEVGEITRNIFKEIKIAADKKNVNLYHYQMIYDFEDNIMLIKGIKK